MKREEITKKEVSAQKNPGRDIVEAITVALVIALLLRFFVVEAFFIPSPSMVPTLSRGDFILVNKFIYGLRIPFTKKRIFQGRMPKRGEIIVFMFPHEQAPPLHKVHKGKDFIKRVIGLPGDKIHLGDYIEKLPDGAETKIEGQLFVNGQPIKKIKLQDVNDLQDFSGPAEIYQEEIGDVKHLIQQLKNGSFSNRNYPNPREESLITVPENSLFVMGDNRDNSSDSRAWGFVPLENLKGKALFIWMSLDLSEEYLFWQIPKLNGIRTDRIAKILI